MMCCIDGVWLVVLSILCVLSSVGLISFFCGLVIVMVNGDVVWNMVL